MNLFILAFQLLVSSPLVHDIDVAYFKLYNDADTIKLEVITELKDLIEEIGVQQEDITADLLNNYFNEHLEFHFDKIGSAISVEEFEIKAKHLFVQANFERKLKSCRNIKIKKTCLLSIEDQSNIIEVRLAKQERDFLMNSDRNTIEVTLKIL